MSGVYYNENDAFAAAWLRTLILFGYIAEGDVDTRSIEDVTPDDLRGYAQHHFFAGIGVWSAALRAAGWPDDQPVWTGSCPCQPFSAAGKGAGFTDERHLWPGWFWLIEQHHPAVILGEQVSNKSGLRWFDLVSADLEGAGYAVGAADLGAASVGAPHIRQRLWFVAHHHQAGQRRLSQPHELAPAGIEAPRRGDAYGSGCLGFAEGQQQYGGRDTRRRRGEPSDAGAVVDAASEQAGLPRRAWEPRSSMADDDDDDPRLEVEREQQARGQRPPAERSGEVEQLAFTDGRDAGAEGLQRGGEQRQQPSHCWSDVEWIPCRDGKWRPTQPGLQPLAHGATARLGRLRGYGNALCLPVAQAFIEAVMACL